MMLCPLHQLATSNYLVVGQNPKYINLTEKFCFIAPGKRHFHLTVTVLEEIYPILAYYYLYYYYIYFLKYPFVLENLRLT